MKILTCEDCILLQTSLGNFEVLPNDALPSTDASSPLCSELKGPGAESETEPTSGVTSAEDGESTAGSKSNFPDGPEQVKLIGMDADRTSDSESGEATSNAASAEEAKALADAYLRVVSDDRDKEVADALGSTNDTDSIEEVPRFSSIPSPCPDNSLTDDYDQMEVNETLVIEHLFTYMLNYFSTIDEYSFNRVIKSCVDADTLALLAHHRSVSVRCTVVRVSVSIMFIQFWFLFVYLVIPVFE